MSSISPNVQQMLHAGQSETREISLFDWNPPTREQLDALSLTQLQQLNFLKLLSVDNRKHVLIFKRVSQPKAKLIELVLKWIQEGIHCSLANGERCHLNALSAAQEGMYYAHMTNARAEDRLGPPGGVFRMGLVPNQDPKNPNPVCYMQRLLSHHNWEPEWLQVSRSGNCTVIDTPKEPQWIMLMGAGTIKTYEYHLNFNLSLNRTYLEFCPRIEQGDDLSYRWHQITIDYTAKNELARDEELEQRGYPKLDISHSSHHYAKAQYAKHFSFALMVAVGISENIPAFLENPVMFIDAFYMN